MGLDQPKPLASIRKEVYLMKELVRLRMRPSRDKKSFRYMLDYLDASVKSCFKPQHKIVETL
jgi:hypothetical protein